MALNIRNESADEFAEVLKEFTETAYVAGNPFFF